MQMENLRMLCSLGQIKWTGHVLVRLQERGIDPSDVRHCIMSGEIIEEYPMDYPYPSYLVLGLSVGQKWLHVVMGIGNGFLWFITAYYPDLEKWEPGFQHRRGR